MGRLSQSLLLFVFSMVFLMTTIAEVVKIDRLNHEIEGYKTTISKLDTKVNDVYGALRNTETELSKVKQERDTLKSNTNNLTKNLNQVKQQYTEQVQKAKELERQAQVKASRSGVHRTVTVSRGSSPRYSTFKAVATAYGSSIRDGGAGTGKTATGARPVAGRTIAVDRHKIPLGSTVILHSDSYPSINGSYVAEDVGGAIDGNRIDIYMNNRKQMLDFGRRPITVKVVKK